MLKPRRIAYRLAAALIAAAAGFAADVSIAVAQSNNCARLIATLDTLDRNRDFRSYESQAGSRVSRVAISRAQLFDCATAMETSAAKPAAAATNATASP